MKLLLTGKPGVGKTTVIQKCLASAGMSAGGFYTQEIREQGLRQGLRQGLWQGHRIGFSVRTLDGKQGILAHIDYQGGYRVGRYGVDISLFEALALPALEGALQTKAIIIIDEIGKMELFSRRFQEMVIRILDQAKQHLLGVIHQGKGPFEASIKRRRDLEIMAVSRANRNELPARIIALLGGERG
jgi:nucleoside-triphosphatase